MGAVIRQQKQKNSNDGYSHSFRRIQITRQTLRGLITKITSRKEKPQQMSRFGKRQLLRENYLKKWWATERLAFRQWSSKWVKNMLKNEWKPCELYSKSWSEKNKIKRRWGASTKKSWNYTKNSKRFRKGKRSSMKTETQFSTMINKNLNLLNKWLTKIKTTTKEMYLRKSRILLPMSSLPSKSKKHKVMNLIKS